MSRTYVNDDMALLWLRTAAAQQRSATARKSQVAVAIALTVCE